MVSGFDRCHRARWKKWQKHSELQGREVDIILCQRTFLTTVKIQKRCRAIFGKHHELDVQHWSEKVRYWIRRIGHPNGIQYRSDARSSTRSGSGAQSLSSHSVDVHRGRISGSVVSRGLPSIQVRLDEHRPSPEQDMVDITMLVAGHTMCSTERKVNESG